MQMFVSESGRRPLVLMFCLVLGASTPVFAGRDAAPARADLVAKPKTVRLLTVGNSFSQDATGYLTDLVKASGDVLIQHHAAVGGASFEVHCEKARLHEIDPDDPRGLYNTKKSLKQELLAEPWDFITIQQASIRSHDVSTYRPFARTLYDYIKRYAPHARVLMHETWAYRRDDPRFSVKNPRSGEPADQVAMYRGLAKAYRTIAQEIGMSIIPVGTAFHLADSHPKWGYRPDPKFDFTTAVYPQLPRQTHSLHKGWFWIKGDDGTYVLKLDGHHASEAGRYLGACVFYDVLYGKTTVGNAFRPNGINADDARFLQETASQAVGRIKLKTETPVEATP